MFVISMVGMFGGCLGEHGLSLVFGDFLGGVLKFSLDKLGLSLYSIRAGFRVVVNLILR